MGQNETQQTVREWARKTFGEPKPTAVVRKALSECLELIEALERGNLQKAREELADVLIVCWQIPGFCSDLFSYTDEETPLELLACSIHLELSWVLHRFLRTNQPKLIASYLKIVWIKMQSLAKSLNCDLQADVDRKMQINRARTWKLHGDGTAQHVPTTAELAEIDGEDQ